MKRRDFEDRVQSASQGIGSAIDSAPRRSVVAAFLLGMIAAIFPGVVFPLLVVAAAVVVAFWYVCEPEVPAAVEAGGEISPASAAAAERPNPAEPKKPASPGKRRAKQGDAEEKVNGSTPAPASEGS